MRWLNRKARQGPGSHVEEFGLYLQTMSELRTDFK